jgi:hypothetical protein
VRLTVLRVSHVWLTVEHNLAAMVLQLSHAQDRPGDWQHLEHECNWLATLKVTGDLTLAQHLQALASSSNCIAWII